jgi:hypothetical protein
MAYIFYAHSPGKLTTATWVHSVGLEYINYPAAYCITGKMTKTLAGGISEWSRA